MMETFKEFTFEAAHQTPPYSGMHGHSFRVMCFLRGIADPIYGWSHNPDEVQGVIDGIKQVIDHRYLNDIEGLEVPTLENVAAWILRNLRQRIDGLDRVSVSRGTQGQMEGCTVA